MTCPGRSAIGTSFIECTAMSASPRASASSSSFTKRPLPPIFASEVSSLRSPSVVMPRISTASAGMRLPASRAWTWRACHSASADSRVAMTMRAGDGAHCRPSSRTMCCWRRLTAIFSSQPSSSASHWPSPSPRAALEAAHRGARDQAVAMHAHEALAVLLLEPRERLLDQVLALGGAHGHVLQLRLEVDHVVHRDEVDAPALLRREKRRRALARSRAAPRRSARAPSARARALPSAARRGSASAGSRSRALRTRGSRRRRRRS